VFGYKNHIGIDRRHIFISVVSCCDCKVMALYAGDWRGEKITHQKSQKVCCFVIYRMHSNTEKRQKMGPDERHEAIMRHLLSAQSADLDTLVALCAVSRMTIHRDLDAMADAGLLRKVRGGATLTPTNQIESSYQYRAQLAPKDKLRIAHYAAQMIEPGMTLSLIHI